MSTDKSLRGSASQFFVAGELCRRGVVAVITMGNCPNTDILCSDVKGTKFAHVQVKTFRPGDHDCHVGLKSQIDYGENFFWVLCGIPEANDCSKHVYYIIPSNDLAKNINECHTIWLDTPGKNGQAHSDNSRVRVVMIPPRVHSNGWDISNYENTWDRIINRLT